MAKQTQKKIWIDLDNSPHVPFFRPIISELEKQGFIILLTIRNCSQTVQLAELFNFRYKKIGKHYGKNKLLKVAGTLFRCLQLMPLIIREKPSIAVSHGSRSLTICASILKIPVLTLIDYEYTKGWINIDWLLIPDIIPKSAYPFSPERILTYPKIKEDVYVPNFKPDPSILSDLNIPRGNILTTIRPPANAAHYHNPESDKLFEEVIRYLAELKNVNMVILPRYDSQKAEIKATYTQLVEQRTIIIPDKVYDGLNLIWFSDFVVSGGGTMNREAAALHVPVYSIFRGKIGAVDKYLSREGRLVLIESVSDVSTKIKVEHRLLPEKPAAADDETLNSVVGSIAKIWEYETATGQEKEILRVGLGSER
ncbi:MAG TPA: DUF354 domain-containing protein [Chitinispirillaceae bacterium]|nr:DUF354 domain-containing protein [Chitinispirillaceae bacterium]